MPLLSAKFSQLCDILGLCFAVVLKYCNGMFGGMEEGQHCCITALGGASDGGLDTAMACPFFYGQSRSRVDLVSGAQWKSREHELHVRAGCDDEVSFPLHA